VSAWATRIVYLSLAASFSHLANLEAVVDLVLERAHLDLADELTLDGKRM